MIWRRLRVDGQVSLANLHDIIQVIYSWDDDHLHQFHIYGKDYGICYTGGISFSDNAHYVHLDKFNFDIGDKFTYEYNFFENWIHEIRIENIDESDLETRHAFCTKGSGMPGYTKHDEIDATLKFLKVIVKSTKLTKISDIRHLIEKLDSVRFNRKKVNAHLAEILYE